MKNLTTADRMIKIIGSPKVEAFNPIKVFTDEKEFYGSAELSKIFYGYETSLSGRIAVMKEFPFVRAYVMDDGSIYRLYKLPSNNNIEILRKISIYSCISNSGVCEAICFDDSFIINRTNYYEKSDKSFAALAKLNVTITD